MAEPTPIPAEAVSPAPASPPGGPPGSGAAPGGGTPAAAPPPPPAPALAAPPPPDGMAGPGDEELPPAPPASPRRWRGEPGDENLARRAERQRSLYIVIVVGLVLLGTLGGLLSWLQPLPRPVLLSLVVSEYKARALPPNAQADRDRDALIQGDFFYRRVSGTFGSQQRHLFEKELSALAKRSEKEPLVVSLQSLAVVADGQILLIPGDAPLDNLERGIPLRAVLESLRQARCARKLLILDIMRPVADSRYGVLVDEVSSRVPDELAAVPDPRRLVLCACSPGQQSLTSEDLGRSVFGYYLEEGLRGYADGWGPRRGKDGRLWVSELADFVKARVDRWAKLNRDTRQTPVLIGSGRDFYIHVFYSVSDHLEFANPSAYPAWLKEGWQLRDRWWTDGGYRMAPRVFRELEAYLSRAEQRWREGIAEARVQAELQGQLTTLRQTMDRLRSSRRPEFRSLMARQAAEGTTVDPKLVDALAKVYAKIAEAAKTAKPEDEPKLRELQNNSIEEFLKTFQGTHYDLAFTVWHLAVSDEKISPLRIRFLAGVTQAQERQPRFVEILTLHRLAELSHEATRGGLVWPVDLVHRLLLLTQRAERAAHDAGAFPWTRAALMVAAQSRHDAEALFHALGFSRLADVEGALSRAERDYQTVEAQATIAAGAQRWLDEAMALIPAYVPYLESSSRVEELTWKRAVEAAIDLQTALRQEPRAEALAELQHRSDALRAWLLALREPFSDAALARLKARGELETAVPQDVSFHRQAEDLLRVPFWSAEQRVALWTASRKIAQRLLAESTRQDYDEDETQTRKNYPTDFDRDRQAFERVERERGLRRASLALELFRLAGVPAGDWERIHKEFLDCQRSASIPDTWQNLAILLREYWQDKLPALFQGEKDPRLQDHLTWILPPFDPFDMHEEASAAKGLTLTSLDARRQLLDVRASLRAQAQRQLWGWLADHFRYQTRDPLTYAELFAAAAQEHRYFADQVPAESFIDIGGAAEFPNLVGGNPATGMLRLDGVGAAPTGDPDLQVDFFTPDDSWLKLTPDRTGLTRFLAGGDAPRHSTGTANRSALLPVRVALLPGAERSGVPEPKGFLLRVRLQGRSYHQRVPLSLTPQPEILLTNAPDPNSAVGDLRLRPSGARESYYVWIRNPHKPARKIVVELRDGLGGPRVASKPLEVAPGKTERVVFGDPPPMPLTELPVFKGALRIHVLDQADNNKLVAAKEFGVEVASPQEYVRVTEIRFDTPPLSTAKGPVANELRVRMSALRPLTPAAKVELAFPPNLIEGVRGIKDRNTTGELPPPGKLLELYARQLDLAPNAKGILALHVDGVERAFLYRTGFGTGNPAPVAQPLLRIRAEQYTKPVPKFRVSVESDNAPASSRLEISLGRFEQGEFLADSGTRIYAGARDRRVAMTHLSADGALIFEGTQRDWSDDYSLEQIRGVRQIRARLIDDNGADLQPPVATYYGITIDETPPSKENLQFVNLPKIGRVGRVLPVQLAGSDEESGLTAVAFFLGDLNAKGEIPMEISVIPANPMNEGRTLWQAEIQLPEKVGSYTLSARAINGVGQQQFVKQIIPVREMRGTIRGNVTRQDIPQPAEVPVLLFNAKNERVRDTKTKAKGEYIFEEVEPGDYTVYCEREVSGKPLRSQRVVKITNDETVTANLELR